jgi:hypothetical protein
VRVGRPIEFTLEAMEDIEDLPAVARQLSRLGELGRVACGQADPCLRELIVDARARADEPMVHALRVLYRVEPDQIVVLSASAAPPALH